METQKENAAALPIKCRCCNREMRTPLACQGCRTLYPEATALDHFQFFGLPRKFDLNAKELHRKFLSISRSVHPDYFAGASDEMRALALRMSAEVNEAYEGLKNPRTRAEYMLELAGGKSSAEDKTVPESLLAEVFLLQEEIEEAQASGDTSALTGLKQRLTERVEMMMTEAGRIADSLEGGDLEPPGSETLDRLRKGLNGIKYLENLIEKI